MVFSSLIFLFRFLPLFLAAYFLAPKRMRNLVLFFGSLIFYAWGEPVYILLMLFSTGSDYIHGILIERQRENARPKRAKGLLVSSLAVNLLMLGYFKYSGQVALPIGISFYTFQTMSYTIDVYRGQARAQKNFIAFGAFVAMFPQLIAGPVVQYKTIARALTQRRENADDVLYGIRRFILGLAKKALLANQAGLVYTQIIRLPAAELTTAGAWLGIVCFAFQIYFDFSGYSDMAVGLGAMLGFHLPENFRYPYTAASVTQFWRRWHITLGAWFREYVYIPLGGNRKGLGRQIINILIVWALTGIWHGASWNFLLWGLWFAVFLMLEKVIGAVWKDRKAVFANKVLGRCYTLLVVLLGWVLFCFEDAGAMRGYLAVLFGLAGAGLSDASILYELCSQASLFICLLFGSTPLPGRIVNAMLAKLGRLRMAAEAAALAGLFLLSVAFIVDASYNPFLYFRF